MQARDQHVGFTLVSNSGVGHFHKMAMPRKESQSFGRYCEAGQGVMERADVNDEASHEPKIAIEEAVFSLSSWLQWYLENPLKILTLL